MADADRTDELESHHRLPPPQQHENGDNYCDNGDEEKDQKEEEEEVENIDDPLKKATIALASASALNVDQGRIISNRNELIRKQSLEIETLQSDCQLQSEKVEELENHLATSIAQGETYWRAAEALKAKLSVLESKCDDQGQLKARIDELESSMASLRSLREQAEHRAVAEMKAQSEADLQTSQLRSKVESQNSAIVTLSQEVVRLKRKLSLHCDGAQNDVESRAKNTAEQELLGGPGDDDRLEELQARISQAESSATASNALYVEEKLKRVSAEEALREFRESEARATAKRRAAFEVEKKNLTVQVREAIQAAAHSTEEASNLRAQIRTLEEELAVCSSRLSERQTVMATLIDEFDHFRSTSLQEAQEELDEVCQVVEVQQAEIEHLRDTAMNSSNNSDDSSTGVSRCNAESEFAGLDDSDTKLVTDKYFVDLLEEHKGEIALRDQRVAEAVDMVNQSANALAAEQKLQEERNARTDDLVNSLLAQQKSAKKELDIWKLKCMELETVNGDLTRAMSLLRKKFSDNLASSQAPLQKKNKSTPTSARWSGQTPVYSPRTPPQKVRAMKRSARVVSPLDDYRIKRQGKFAHE